MNNSNEEFNAISGVFEKLNQVKAQLEHELGEPVSYRKTMEEMGLPPKLIDDLEKAIEMHNSNQLGNED